MMDKAEIEKIAKSALKQRGLDRWVVTWVEKRNGINAWSVAVGDGDHHCPIEFESESKLTDELVSRFINRGIDRCLGTETTF